MKLPESFVAEWLPTATGCRFMGVPVEELTREELIAAAMFSWSETVKEREELRRRTEFLLDLGRSTRRAA